RLPGPIRTYSKNAMTQLTMMACQRGAALNLKCPYHAKVMNTFEQVSKTTGSQRLIITRSLIDELEFVLPPKIASPRPPSAPRNGRCSPQAPHRLCLQAAPRPYVRKYRLHRSRPPEHRLTR